MVNKIIVFFWVFMNASVDFIEVRDITALKQEAINVNFETLVIIDLFNLYIFYKNTELNLENKVLFKQYTKKYKISRKVIEELKLEFVEDSKIWKIFEILKLKDVSILPIMNKRNYRNYKYDSLPINNKNYKFNIYYYSKIEHLFEIERFFRQYKRIVVISSNKDFVYQLIKYSENIDLNIKIIYYSMNLNLPLTSFDMKNRIKSLALKN